MTAPADSRDRIGVLLVNLGTPDATDFRSMRRYLREFLSDKRVIEDNSLTWKLVFNGIVLTTRPRAKGRDYDSIWNRERDESPLKTITRSQADKLAADLAADPAADPAANPAMARVVVDWAMRYGNPSIAARIEALVGQGCTRLLVLPLYPQYAAATTATVGDAVFRKLMAMRFQPALRIAPPYHDDPVYIEAITASLRAALQKLSFTPDVILASFHGIPKDYADQGDPYPEHCAITTRLMREKLGYDETRLRMTFQSRFGRAEWLQPYTDKTVEALAKGGVKNLAVITPGFAADCLETLEEIAVENRDIFKENGGENFAAIPCLNDTDAGMAVIGHLVRRELQGWV